METIIRNVRDLPKPDRSALERVVGHELCESQQVIVNVINLDASETPRTDPDAADVPVWWNIYEGLSDEEINRLDEAIRPRANLTRGSE
jgi:hypothetical protein